MEIIDIIKYIAIGVAVLILIIGLAIVNFSAEEFISRYNEYNQDASSYFNTIEFLNMVCQEELHRAITVKLTPELYRESYSAYYNTIQIGNDLANSYSITGFAIIAHELGHAMQYRDNAKKMNKFAKKSILINFLSYMFFPLIIASIVLLFVLPELSFIGYICLGLAGLVFGLSISLKLSTLKIEKEASQNAVYLLEKYAGFDDYKIADAKTLLKAAKNTYLADVLRSLLKWTFLVR